LKREYSARRKSEPPISGNASSSWPTATAQDSKASGAAGYQTETRHAGMTLTDAAVRLWPTARATDGTKGGPNQRGSKGDLTLPSAAAQWPTPTSRDHKGGADWSRRTRDGKPRPDSDRTLPDVAERWPIPAQCGSNRSGGMGRVGPIRPSHRVLETQKGGRGCRMMLNPLFVELLMGFPPGWTASDALEMPSYRRWRRLHGAPCVEDSEDSDGI
jgi:DNA (cytosine-5)-methyltransferase 1